MSWNLGQGKTWRSDDKGSDRTDIDEVARDILAGRADVALVQEVYKRDLDLLEQKLKALEAQNAEREGRAARDIDITFSKTDEKRRYEEHGKGNAGRLAYGEDFGNAIITFGASDHRPIVNEKLPSDLDEPRTILGVETTINGQDVRLFTTHTTIRKPFVPAPRAPQIYDPHREQIEAVFKAADGQGPMILTGDFNTQLDANGQPVDGSGAAKALASYRDYGYTDAAAASGNTHPTSVDGTGRRIDYVFTEGLDVVASYTLEPGTSDHAGVVVDVRFPPSTEEPARVPSGAGRMQAV